MEKGRYLKMKTTIYFLGCMAIILAAMPLLASNTMNIEASLREILLSDSTPRLSGKGTYIRTAFKKALDVNDLLEAREFKDDEQKQRYLRIVRLTTGLDLSLKEDKATHTLERLYFDQNKKRRDYASLSTAMLDRIRNDPNIIDTLSFSTMVFDGDKSISLTSVQNLQGTTDTYVNISRRKIYFPKFHQFGHDQSPKHSQLQMFTDVINQGLASIKRSTINGQVHATLEMANVGFKLERILAPDKGMSILYTALYENNKLNNEIICQEYAESTSGEWFPRKYISKKYVYVRGEKILSSSETFEAIPGSVNFNVPIKPSIFSPELPAGANVIDDRYNPPKQFFTEAPAE